jgi:hypothetical protein
MKTSTSRLGKLIAHEGFWLMALSILLIPQVASSFKVFAYNNAQYESPWFAWCYAVGIDLAILIFTVKGRLVIAFLYLLVMIAHALIGQFLPYQSSYGIFLVHTTLPITIFSFSHLFYYEKRKSKQAEDTASLPQGSTEQAHYTAMTAQGIRLEPQAYLCPECGLGATTAKKLNGHISGHKMKQEWHPENYGDWEKENELRAAALIKMESEYSQNETTNE